VSIPLKNLEALVARMGRDSVRAEPKITAAHTVDGRVPRAVVFPKNTDQVSQAVRFADREHLSVVPWGSGSKMAMGNPPERLDLVVSTARMNHMIDVDTANLTMTVEAGVKFRDRRGWAPRRIDATSPWKTWLRRRTR
jgi:FAD/FMN-containing dehydrogenase